MLDKLLDIIHDLNEDNVVEAANKVLELVRESSDEKIIKLASEIEKEVREMREENELLHVVDPAYSSQLKDVLKELEEVRKKKVKVLISSIVHTLGENNFLVRELLNSKRVEIKPHTYI
ncbi:hypothetical protein WIW90_03795 [Sulfolobaceae archaeon RB850M]|jgi:predicted SpoU family rRNA methylase|nr:hypothetical protein DDW01_01435 [Sulfolobus sp. SCGC AB-777_G05]